jgi:hypothetical protein
MGEVVDLDVVTTLDLDPDRILDRAKGQLETVIIIGVDEDGDEYFASSVADGGSALWMMERAKKALLETPD